MSSVTVPGVLAEQLLRVRLRDRDLGGLLDFIVKQLLAIAVEEAGTSLPPASVGKLFPVPELMYGGQEDATLYELRDGSRALPVADRSVWTAPQITANQGEYNLGDRFYNRLSTDAARIINGILSSVHGRRGLIINVGTQRLTLAHDNAGATSTSFRILCVGSADIVLLANDMAFIWRDNVSARWRAAKL